MTDEIRTEVLPAGRGKRGRARRSKTHGSGTSNAGTSRKAERATRTDTAQSRSRQPDDSGTVLIELSKAQVDQVVRAAGQGGTMSVLLSALRDPEWTLAIDSEDWSYPTQMDDRRLSRSLLSGLLVLSCFPADGGYLGIADLARMLDMNTSTTHRYVTTLLAVGLLERDSATRRYRLASQ
jgi:hypothetical protein